MPVVDGSVVARWTGMLKDPGSIPGGGRKKILSLLGFRTCLDVCCLVLNHVRPIGSRVGEWRLRYNPSLWECAKTTGGTCFLCILASLFMISECLS